MPLRVGTCLPSGCLFEFDGVAPTDLWSKVVAAAEHIEELGYEAVWCGDHTHPSPWLNHSRPKGTPRLVTPVLEVWTTLAGLSQRVPTIRLGQLVNSVGFRSPAILAKQAAMLDVMSGGRLELGIGAGWLQSEHLAYGQPFPSGKERIQMVREAVEIVRRMWTEREVTFQGEHYQIVRAQLEPKPLQDLPPILIGGGGRVMLRVVAELADKWNYMGTFEEFEAAHAVLVDHCRDIGRDPDSVALTWSETGVVIRQNEDDARRDSELVCRQTGTPAFRSWLWGTPEQVAEKIAPFIKAGVTEIMPHMPERTGTESLELFITRVVPELRRIAS